MDLRTVHVDGNGRTSRVLSTLCLDKAGYDFKRLFTISEYYDRNRPTFHESIQSVRENGMDMTVWLDYFITGLETQIIEVKMNAITNTISRVKHGVMIASTARSCFLGGCR